MFISVLELFKIGIGPSSSHTLGPMVAAKNFAGRLKKYYSTEPPAQDTYLRCILKGSLAYTGKGHSTDRAIALGLHGHSPEKLVNKDVDRLVEHIWECDRLHLDDTQSIMFSPNDNIVFSKGEPLPEHPNGIIFELVGGRSSRQKRRCLYRK